MRPAALLTLAVALALSMPFAAVAEAAAAPPAADAEIDRLTALYYDEWAVANPTAATAMGIHSQDSQLDDLSVEHIATERARLASWAGRFAAIARQQEDANAPKLSAARAIDLAFLRSAIASILLELDETRSFARYPSVYPRLASESVYNVIKRDFAPAPERLKSVIARERKIPLLLKQGWDNLSVDRVARVSVGIAREELEGIRGFFAGDVPKAFTDVKDTALQRELREAGAGVDAALANYGQLLDRLDKSAHGSFALGEPLYRKKVIAEEMIDTPIDQLLTVGEAELARLQREFIATAKRIDPKRPAAEVQHDLGLDHPPADQVVAETQARLAALREFVVTHHIASIPSKVLPRVQETPPFMRATTFASMETPGPFETRSTEAYYNETLPEPSWPAAKQQEFLAGYSRPLTDVVSIHEVFPGHYVQFLWVPKIAGLVRKYEGAKSNIEGWAHYCEQMMLDEGWESGSPRIRLAQVQDALLRAARFVVGVRMHTRGMTYEEAVKFFVTEGKQTQSIAEMEAKRGTEDPTYLVYTLGKLELLRLRDDYRKKLGKSYALQTFHDAILAEGPLPLPLLRRALLGN